MTYLLDAYDAEFYEQHLENGEDGERERKVADDIAAILRAFAEEDICQCNCGCERDAETADGRDTPLCSACYRNC